MITISKVYAALREVVDQTQNKDIVDCGYVQNIVIEEGNVKLDIILPSADHPHLKEIQEKVHHALSQLIGVGEIKVTYKSRHANPGAQPLKSVKNIIAVSSCKGGVGKSTLAVHIARELASRKLKIGLVDADVFGPSLPTLLNLHGVNVYTNDRQQLIPIQHEELKVMSFGFLMGDNPAVMRGPIVTRYIQQLLLNTDWGELDYLIIDMPPGTGDVHLTITQSLRLTGAVIVTTPHGLSLIDVARGILMFEKVNVPILGVIENMAYFETPDKERHYIFGESSAHQLEKRFGVRTLAEIPIVKDLSQLHGQWRANPYIQKTVDQLLASLKQIQHAPEIPKIQFDQNKIEFQWKDGRHWQVKNFDLRINSQDAYSVDEMTGKSLIKPENIRRDIAPKEITALGNYAIGVAWNDGHSAGIYPYKLIEQLADKT